MCVLASGEMGGRCCLCEDDENVKEGGEGILSVALV
jgi:hypothetical protein